MWAARLADKKLESAQVLHGVDDHAATNRNQQDVACNAHKFVSDRRCSQLHNYRWRYGMVNNTGRQRLAHSPLFYLSGRHATVVLFGKTWRATARTVLLRVVVANHAALGHREIIVERYVCLLAPVFVLLVCVLFFFSFFVFFTVSSPIWFFSQGRGYERSGNQKHGQERNAKGF